MKLYFENIQYVESLDREIIEWLEMKKKEGEEIEKDLLI